MKLIDYKTPGVLNGSADQNYTGRIVVLRKSAGSRFAVRKLQLHRATGGNGCEPDKLGSGVFVDPLYVEHPPGSGKLREATKHDRDEHSFKSRRNEIIGCASDELVRDVAADPSEIEPGDPRDFCVMAVHLGSYFKADTAREAWIGVGRPKIKETTFVVAHREAYIADVGYLVTPGWVRSAVGGAGWRKVVDAGEKTQQMVIIDELAAEAIAELRAAVPA